MSHFGIGREGATFASVMIIVAGIALVLAVAMPTLRAHSFRALVDEAAADVETLRVASEQHFASARAWPTAGGPGAIPAEVANAFPGRSSLTRDEYSIQWSVLEMLEEREVDSDSTATPADADAAPDSVQLARVSSLPVGIGGITLRSGQDELLAELLARYGPQASFVRDSTWTLIVGVTPGG